jgi:hypothetical protein
VFCSMYYLFIVYYLFGCICYLYCINAATGWTTHLQFNDNNNNNNNNNNKGAGPEVLTVVTIEVDRLG